jgi:hypothetical protein
VRFPYRRPPEQPRHETALYEDWRCRRPDGLATVLTDASLAGCPAMSQFENAMYVITAMAVVVLVMGWRP